MQKRITTAQALKEMQITTEKRLREFERDYSAWCEAMTGKPALLIPQNHLGYRQWEQTSLPWLRELYRLRVGQKAAWLEALLELKWMQPTWTAERPAAPVSAEYAEVY